MVRTSDVLWKVILYLGEIHNLAIAYTLSFRSTGFAQFSEKAFGSHLRKRALSLENSKWNPVEYKEQQME